MTTTRLTVAKTYKLYIKGAFVRPESGTSEPTTAHGSIRQLPVASRKDTRDAVVAAVSALPAWSGKTAYNRGQVIYRIAEMLESNFAAFADALVGSGLDRATATADLAAAIDQVVWYAGWTDKLDTVIGSTNPVAGPYLNVTMTAPTGVVAAFATESPTRSALHHALTLIAAALASASTVVLVVQPGPQALPVLDLAEIIATSDVPAGAVNILTGARPEVGTTLATHQNVNALVLANDMPDTSVVDLERTAAATLKRVVRPTFDPCADHQGAYGLLTSLVETTTVWHSLGT
jgi:acyl-CoA reductase-like NAD-dependent aldehyde dehydrogenase